MNQFFNATPGSTLSRIVINGSTASITGAYTSGTGPFTCDSSILHFAYYVVTNYVNNGNHVTNLRNNDFDNLYYMGVYAPSNCVMKFKNNAMRFRVRTIGQTTHYAFYLSGSPSSPNFHEVINNRFDSLYSYGAYLIGAGNPAPNKNVLANNTFSRGINFASATTYLTMISATNSNWNIFHNSYNLNNNNSNAYGLYVSFGANNTIKNNIFACTNTNGSLHYPLYISSTTYVDSMDYNIFYNVASGSLAYRAGTIMTQANLGTAWPTGLGINSKYANPGFVSTSNLHVNSSFICAGLAPNVGITTDMDEQSRGGTTTIGADEAVAVTNDLGIDSLLNPATLSITPGTTDIRVRVRNTGSNSLLTGDVTLVLNGTPTTLTLPGTLNACDTVTITFPGQTFVAGFNTMLIFTSAPNASADNNTSNDSLYNIYCSSIAGTFTIDKTSPISATNFPSIASAINAIYSCGISGPVTFNIVSGTGPYVEQNIFNGIVPGSSPTNTITINGGATKETVEFQGGSQGSSHVFRLIGAKWITLKNMTVRTLDPNWGVGFNLCNGSDSNTVKGNNIVITGSMTDTRNCGIAMNGLGTSVTTFPTSVANIPDYNTIDSNTITGGYYAIVSIGWSNSTGSQAESNVITNNICTGMYQYGCYMYYQHGIKFNGNTFTMSPSAVTSNYGILAYYWDGFEFKSNKINNAGTYGVYFLSPGQAGGFNGSDSFEISNNMIGGNFLGTGTIYGLYITNNTFLYRARIMNNTISITPPVSNTNILYGIRFNTGYTTNGYWDNNIFKNNTISLFGAASSSFPIYLPFNAGLTPTLPFSIGGANQMDYNNFFTSDPSGNTAFIQGTTYNLNNFVGASGMNVNSKNLNPVFINNLTNLHTISPNLNAVGTPISYITTDIDGQARNATTPDIGADEFDVAAENIGAFAVVAPAFPMTPGLQNVVVNIKNFGTVPVTSANVRYKVGALGSTKTIAWTGTLAIGGNTNITFTGANQHNFAGGFDTIYAWTDGPNGTTDGYQLNDSIANVVCSPLSGTYTVNASSPATITNFQNFASLVSRLTSCGVSGPVVVNVATGVYTEQMQFAEISGASPTNTITIQSAALNADSVLIQFNSASNSTNNYVVDLNGSDYFRFHHLTLSNAVSLGFNGVVIMRNTARANQFTNNKFLSNGSLSTSSNQVVFYVLSNTNALSDDSLVLIKNLFNSGSYGFYALSSTQPKYNYFVDSNTFNSQQYMRIYMSNLRNSIFTNNIVNCNSAYSFPYGMYFTSCSASGADFVISKNKMTGNPYYGLYLTACNGTLVNPFLVTNNFLVGNGANGSNGSYVLYCSSIGGCRFYNNSILNTIGNTGMYSVYLQSISTPVNHFKHNIVYAKGSGTVSPYVLYISTTSPSNILIDSNVYFQGTGATGFAATPGAQATFASYKTLMNGIGQEDYTVSTNPLFVSNTDLHTTSPTNLLSIMTNSSVTDDIDNATRSGLSDAGADHHPLANDLGVESIVYPNAGVAGAGLRDIKFVIRNYGVNTITSSTVGYNVDGHIETKPWTGSLAAGQRDTITFNGAQQHNFIGTIFSMSAWVDSISPLIYNDTLYTYGCIGLAGTYTIGGTPGPTNFTNFTSAVNAMAGCGISGPVTFNVAPGDYTEQVDIPAISGQSAANTITFDGGNPLTTQLRFACTGFTPGNYVLRFNGTNYVTFRNLAISNTTNTSTSSNILVFNSTNIRIVKCMIGDNNTTPSSVSGQSSTASLYRIALTKNATNPKTPSTVNHNIFIDSNIINFDYYDIWSAGNLPTAKIYTTNNVFNGQYLYDAYHSGAQVPYIYNNFFNTRTAGSLTTSHSSIYLTGVIPAVTEKIEIYKNTIDSFNGTAIYLGSSGIAANYNMCVNNVIYGNFGAGIVYGIQAPVQYWRYLHNSINLGSNGAAGGYCLYVSSTLNDCRNNVFTITATGLSTSVPVYASSAAAFNNFNYNMFFNGTNGNVLQIGAFTYTQANFQAPYSGGAGANSVWANPNYASASNLHLSTALGCTIAGTPAGITTDMDGQTRSLLAPTMGADEVVRLATDLAVENITNPSTSSQPAGPATVAVLVRNVGNNQITSGNISAQLNYNGTVFTVAFTDTINPCDTHTLFIPGVVFGGSGNPVDTLKVFSDGPNGTTDNNLLNDTTRRIICGPLNGTYTIGGASPDFVDMAATVLIILSSTS
ncbi:MAG: hypothetical protein IPK03_04960 [Bacteroidetes bacterium]|nr:hypothetical protein [Bacteroidota bacterium]